MGFSLPSLLPCGRWHVSPDRRRRRSQNGGGENARDVAIDDAVRSIEDEKAVYCVRLDWRICIPGRHGSGTGPGKRPLVLWRAV